MKPTPEAAFGRLPLKGATPADRRSRIRGVRLEWPPLPLAGEGWGEGLRFMLGGG